MRRHVALCVKMTDDAEDVDDDDDDDDEVTSFCTRILGFTS